MDPSKHSTIGRGDDSESVSKNDPPVAVSESIDGGDGRQKDTVTRKFLRIIWDSLDKSPQERKFINKVDCWIMTYICVAYFVKYLDQTNVRVAPHTNL